MRFLPAAPGSARYGPLVPLWLVVVLLPFGRSAELGTLLCLPGLWWFVYRGLKPWHSPGGMLLLLLLGAYTGAALESAFTAVAPAKSWLCVTGLLRYLPLGLYTLTVLRQRAGLHTLYYGVAMVLVVWAGVAWLQMLTGWHVRGVVSGAYLTGLFGDNLKSGSTLAVLSPFVLWATRQCWGRPGLLVASLLLMGPILLAGSRSAWFCYVLVVLAFAWKATTSGSGFMGLCAFVAVLLCLAGGLAWQVSPRFDARMQRTLHLFDGDPQSVNVALTGRLDIWKVSLRMIAADPLTGVGVRGFRYAYPQYAPIDDHFVTVESCGPGQGACHPHQWLLEVLTETGMVGFLLWMAAILSAWRIWSRTDGLARRQAFPVTVALVVMLFPLNSHPAFYSAWWGLLFIWLLALWCAALFADEGGHWGRSAWGHHPGQSGYIAVGGLKNH